MTLFYYFKSIVSGILTWQNLNLKIIKELLEFKKIYWYSILRNLEDLNPLNTPNLFFKTIVYKSLIIDFIFKNQNLKLLPILIYKKSTNQCDNIWLI